ncbi:hypothetical protein LENED_003832 [Lentinula edodes]|uniref:WW domain-containing protein n=1 Tax=Lentinula edodes TaxID=5353 RepID=A0A1Q3E4M7_LENED|nr:hypothetical protein LENED_003832 [Lentinula edodes]
MQSAAPVNPDRRVLPPGWTEGYNAQKDTWYYVQTNVVPARISYFHPSTEYYAETNRVAVDEAGPSSSSNSYVQQGSSSSSKLQGRNENSDWKPDQKDPMLFNHNAGPITSSSSSSGPSTGPAPSISYSPSSIGHLPPDPTSSVDPSSPPQYSIYSESSDEHSTLSAVVAPGPGSDSSSSPGETTTANVVSPPEYHNPSFLSSPPPASSPAPPPPPSSSLPVTQMVGPPSSQPVPPENHPQPFPSTPHTSNTTNTVNVNSLPAPHPDSTGMNLVSHLSQAQVVNNASPSLIHTGQNPHAHVPGMHLVDRPSQAPVGVSSLSLPPHPPIPQPTSAPVTTTTAPPPPNVPVPTSNAPTPAPATAGHEGLTLAQRLTSSESDFRAFESTSNHSVDEFTLCRR